MKSSRILRSLLIGCCIIASTNSIFAQSSTDYTWTGATNTTFGTTTNWSGGTVAPSNGGETTYAARINVLNGSDSALTYTAAQGTTIYQSTGRSLVIGSTAPISAAGSMIITGGTFDSRGAADDLISNAQNGTLTIDGGHYINTNGGSSVFAVKFNSSGTGTLNIESGSFTSGVIQFGGVDASTGGAGIVNLNGGILEVGSIREGVTENSATAMTSTFNFNGGTLRARADNATFIGANDVDTARVQANGAIIHSNGFNITIGKALIAGTTTGGGLTKQGDGILTLSADNTYTGNTTISGGVLQIGSGGATGTLGANSNTSIASAAELRINRDNTNFGYNYSGALSGSGTVNILSSMRMNFSTNNQNSSGDLSFTVNGILGVNTSSGVTSVHLGELSGSGTIQRAGTGNDAATLLIGGKNTDSTFAGSINSAGLAITKTGTGTLTLSGINGYTGATQVNGGKLIIGLGGSTAAGSAVSVSNSGSELVVNGTVNGTLIINANTTLSGSGTFKGTTTVSGNLNPGNSPGTMTYENTLTLNSTSITTMEIDGNAGAGVTGGHDFINLIGTDSAGVLTYGGSLILDIGTAFGVGVYSWNLFDFASETGTFASITLADQYSGSLTDGGSGIWGLTSGNNTWSFTESTGTLGLTVIPEPTAALLGGLGVLLLLRRRRVCA